MEYHEYLEYFELLWKYFPYVFYAYVFLTFFTKSLGKIKKFADADYAANRKKYHRCYGPELCCHMLIEDDDGDGWEARMKQKPRKPVTRAYFRKQQTAQQQQRAAGNSIDHDDGVVLQMAAATSLPIKRQVQASAIQTQTNVNQIAKMFESGSGSMAHRKINRVLPEIRTSMYRSFDSESGNDTTAAATATTTTLDNEQQSYNNNDKKSYLLHENIENSMNLLHQQTTNGDSSEATLPTVVLQRRTQRTVAPPNMLSYAAGTSATPSTASPAASSSPHSSPGSTSPVQQPSSPILLRTPAAAVAMPSLNLKTSVEDIFAAIARSAERNEEQFMFTTGSNTLSPVTSIDDILSQRRLSRPLSAYSISDLLANEETCTMSSDDSEQSSINKKNKDENENDNENEKQETETETDNRDYVENLLLSTLNKT